ncbi:Type I restriction-modification system, restriction subunit R [Methanosarcina barkeri 227]|uniref:Type I restriction-modification system, restriction subunit R n=2 Tax=Methanosarcina barkeri TaxID=2208 RepID=A0A0E3LPG5_METBA|nr:Type I restriction-modification system, restriction subunit R [Methanosarcina barkeri MS]AKB59951.1 Type I restriction-modification system, restriction subunit R [Methanosarcina barkeri 227]
MIAVKVSQKINDDRDFGNIFRKALFESVYKHLTERKKK